MNIKRCKPTWTWSTASGSTEMLAFIEDDFRTTLKDCSASDVNSFVLSFRHLEQTISSCFTIKIMQSGWAKAGLIGLELHTIMSHWIGWRMLTAEQVQGIKNLLPSFFMKWLRMALCRTARCKPCSRSLMWTSTIIRLIAAL